MSSINAGLEYTNEDGNVIHCNLRPEKGVKQFSEEDYRKLLHDALDEWLDKSNGTGQFYIMEDPNKTWTFFCRDGGRDVLIGTDPSAALSGAGYGPGAVAALDFWAEGDDHSYEWDKNKRNWIKVEY